MKQADPLDTFAGSYGRLLTIGAQQMRRAGTNMAGHHEIRMALQGRGARCTPGLDTLRRQVFATSAALMRAKQEARNDPALGAKLVTRAQQIKRAVETEWMVEVPVKGAGL